MILGLGLLAGILVIGIFYYVSTHDSSPGPGPGPGPGPIRPQDPPPTDKDEEDPLKRNATETDTHKTDPHEKDDLETVILSADTPNLDESDHMIQTIYLYSKHHPVWVCKNCETENDPEHTTCCVCGCAK